MIFVTVGTHDQEFTRLIKRIDEIAPELKEEIIIQRGDTNYIPKSKNCKSFRFSSDLKPYFRKARLVIAHAGIGTTIEVLREIKKPLILVPRMHRFNEHINDHQIGMTKHFEKKWGVKAIYDIRNLDAELLKKYKMKIVMHDKELEKIRTYVKAIVLEVERRKGRLIR